ncbi:GLTP1 [Symbiodinium pilosum]|uniref:GLTP1 protein n=1 Tax=Symbiodinium pilosum TaxID=2952 RepID=A0A812PZU5_SYMPI|nr:GLTP1 [Symbiodinium pilosum]
MPPPWPPASDDQVSHQVLADSDKDPASGNAMGYVHVGEVPIKAPMPAPVAVPVAAPVVVASAAAPVPVPVATMPVRAPVAHETRFAMLLEKFRDCEIRDGKGAMQDIALAKFFEACELYRDMLSKLGRAASVVVGDIEHNLSKSKAVFLEAPEERKTVTAYLQLPASHVGIEKLTWLCRGVQFFLTMIKNIFGPDTGGNPAVEAYQETLMQYHGWMLQQTVKLGMRAMPSKDGIVQSEGLVLAGDASPEQRKKFCERDAPAASTAGLEVVEWIIELMKKEGKWDAKKA